MPEYPHTVHVHASDGGYRWFCGCGAAHWFIDERTCRGDGLAHQQAHTARAG